MLIGQLGVLKYGNLTIGFGQFQLKCRKMGLIKMKDLKIHESHQMTDFKSEIRCPCETSRFYAVRECKVCGAEEIKHPAGHFFDKELECECRSEEETDD